MLNYFNRFGEEMHHEMYPYDEAQERQVDAGLPEFLAMCTVVELCNARFKLKKPI